MGIMGTIQVPVAHWEAVLVFLFGFWNNFNISTKHYNQQTKPCEYKLKNIGIQKLEYRILWWISKYFSKNKAQRQLQNSSEE